MMLRSLEEERRKESSSYSDYRTFIALTLPKNIRLTLYILTNCSSDFLNLTMPLPAVESFPAVPETSEATDLKSKINVSHVLDATAKGISVHL